jgi:hypothetical protein
MDEAARGSILWTAPKAIAGAGALPVKVRSATGILVGSGISGEAIVVPPGQYSVSVTMPNGHEFAATQQTHVTAGQTVNARIALPDETTRSCITSRANAVSLQMTESLTLESMTGPVGAPVGRHIDAQEWCGEWLGEWKSPKEAFLSGLQDGTVTLSETEQLRLPADDAHDRFLITRHQNIEGQAILRFSIVPHDECIICVGEPEDSRLILAAIREGSNPPSIKFASSISDETNTLLNFVDSGAFGAMQTVAESFVRAGESAMLESRVSLLRGITGAYILMRVNATDHLEDWLKQIGELAPALPDTHALQAELFARLGRHKEAVQALRAATHALCPWFRAGLSYLVERLKFYTDLSEKTRATLDLSDDDWKRFDHARARISRMSPMLALTQVFTTFDIPE